MIMQRALWLYSQYNIGATGPYACLLVNTEPCNQAMQTTHVVLLAACVGDSLHEEAGTEALCNVCGTANQPPKAKSKS